MHFSQTDHNKKGASPGMAAVFAFALLCATGFTGYSSARADDNGGATGTELLGHESDKNTPIVGTISGKDKIPAPSKDPISAKVSKVGNPLDDDQPVPPAHIGRDRDSGNSDRQNLP